MIAAWLRERLAQWRARREAHTLEVRAIPDALWLATLQQFPFLRWRSLAQLEELRRLSTLFLAHKEFSTLDDLGLTDAMAVAVAAQACLPIVALGLGCYDGFVGIVISPDEVLARREWMDEDGVVHTRNDALAGEAMQGGPVLLSWRDVSDAGWTAEAGYNVVVHEFVHVLDMSDGQPADGLPPLPDAGQREHWIAVMGQALEQHAAAVERGADTWLDPYGAQGPEEFLAVTAEAFFVAPHALQAHWPAVYSLFKGYFQQDPARYRH